MNTKFDSFINEMIGSEGSGSDEMEAIRQIRQSLTQNASYLANLKTKALESNNNKVSAALTKALMFVDDARRELFEVQK
jgi:hypothetical protein